MAAKKWVMYGVSGVLGLGVLAGAASLAASAMELHTNDGNVLDGGGVDAGTIVTVDKNGSTQSPKPTPSVTPSPSVTPAPGAGTGGPAPAPPAPAPPAPAPAPPAPAPAPPAPAPVPVDPASPISVPSADSVD
ncbi:hypothetical protein ACQUSY_09980 [Microbacterium sp. YY-03]|uniref:hypothetical protein n=1 Tax=Microbacterium sp. YY-03 TaxID=3421636 RepID=UPI003D16FF45